MILDTLKSSVADWMGRADFTDSQFDVAIEMCEANFTYGVGDIPPLRIRAMETEATLSLTSASVALPTGFLGLRNIYIDYTPKVTPEFMEANVLRRHWPDNATGAPVNYTIEGENIIFAPAPDDTYSAPIIYYKKLTALSPSNTSNWVLANRPDIYLYGVMAELEAMLDGPNVEKYAARYAAAIRATNAQDKDDRVGGSALVMRAAPVGNRIIPR